MKYDNSENHFREFAKSLEREISKYGKTTGSFYERQKAQVEKLIELETTFRQSLIAHPWGPGVYREFVKHIVDERKNILAARPFFRERQDAFTNEISTALKERAEKSLYRFRINFLFVLFVMKARRWSSTNVGAKIVRLANEIQKLRNELIEMNMPLAINRASIFYSRTPKSHLSRMDLIQIASVGLMSGIDKYVPDEEKGFSQVFRAVAIGRMTGNFIEEYSETLLHFYPSDKRKLYRANKAVGRFKAEGVDYERVASSVNSGVDSARATTATEIAGLMAAASTVSADSSTSQDADAPEPIDHFAAPESVRPDHQVEERDTYKRLGEALAQLSIFDRKLLRLKGVKF